jgi:TnpA family transposase
MSQLSEDEIIRDWSINDSDKIFISKFNTNYRLWIYLQLCSLRLFGQLLDNPNSLDGQIIGYACRILRIPIVATAEIPTREATKTEHKKQVFEYLGFSKFEESLDIFQSWLQSVINNGYIIAEKIVSEAESFLIKSKILLPTTYNLKRVINSCCSKKQEELYGNIYKILPKTFIEEADNILLLSDKNKTSWFQKFKEYPGSSTITLLNIYLERYQKLVDLELDKIDISKIPIEFQKHLFGLAKYYSSWQIKRFKTEKRYSLMLAFLLESKKVILDYIIQMHDQYITGIYRGCNNTHENNLKKYKKQNERAIGKIECFIDCALNLEDSSKITLNDIYEKTTSKIDLQQARNDMRKYKIESKYGYANLLQNRYNSMRRYFSEFIKLPFLAETGNEDLINAINIIRQLDNQEISKIPKDIGIKFIDNNIIKSVRDKDENIKRNLLEIGIANAIKEAFRSGDIFIESTNKHVSFWNLVYKEFDWKKRREESYRKLNLEKDNQKATVNLINQFNKSTKGSEVKFKKDDFATIKDGKLILRKKEKVDIPEDVKPIQSLIDSYLPKIKIEQLLVEVDQMTGFTKHFTSIHGQKRNLTNSYKPLIASILAQATNIGLSTMQNCTSDITAEMMRNITDSCIREETIKSANAELVNQHSQLTLSQAYGDGSLSSSDGQRFIISANSLLASLYPRYCGYYDKIVGIYTHTSSQYSVYSTNAISCSPRESLYVIDGFLNNNTILPIKEHTTDTEGYTEHIFALCHLLGIRFMPRIKNLKSQQLYKASKDMNYGEFNTLLTKSVSPNLIEEQWDQMVRITASMKDRLCPAHEIIRRLSKGSPSDKLAKAFTHLGRLIKTQYILEYITNEELRNKVYRQLNKGEHRHALARWIFFANQGKFMIGDYEEIMNKASCLSLASNAILYWNTVKMSEIVCQLRNNGERISDESLSHISLLSHKHVIPMGTYFTDTLL